jgi:hypothetical protein
LRRGEARTEEESGEQSIMTFKGRKREEKKEREM